MDAFRVDRSGEDNRGRCRRLDRRDIHFHPRSERIIQGSAADWLAEATEGETEASNIVKRLQDWAENDFAHAVGEAVAEELKEKRREGSESNGEDR